MSYLQDPRVLFAAERTLLAWNRTGLTFIMFGFLIERSGLLIEILSNGQEVLNTTMTFINGPFSILLCVLSDELIKKSESYFTQQWAICSINCLIQQVSLVRYAVRKYI